MLEEMTQWVKMLAARHGNLSLSQRLTWWKERTDSSRDFHMQAVAHTVSVWAVTRCRVFLIPRRLCCMSEAHTDICLTRLPFQCLSDLMNKCLWVHAWECQEPDFHRSFQWPNRPCPPKPQLPRSFLQMRYGVGGVQCTHFLQTNQSWEFSFLILFVGQHKFFGQPKPMLLSQLDSEGWVIYLTSGSWWFRKHPIWAS